MLFACRDKFLSGRLRKYSCSTAIVAYSAWNRIVDNSSRISSTNGRNIDICHRAVIVIDAASPISPVKTYSCISVAIAYSSIKSNMPSPIPIMPDINAVSPTPITRCPEKAGLRSQYPNTGDPVIAGSVSPITRSPNVVRRSSSFHCTCTVLASEDD